MNVKKAVFWLVIFSLTAGLFFNLYSKFVPGGKPPSNALAAQGVKKYYCPMHPDYTSDKPGDCPICHMRLVAAEASVPAVSAVKPRAKKILFYRHPMQPGVTSPTPAKDEMGMDYVPVYEEGPAAQDPKAVCVTHDCPMVKEGQQCPMLVLAEEGERLECPVCKTRIETRENQKIQLTKEGYATILISPQKQQLIGIKTSLVERKDIQKPIRAVGRIAYDPELYQAEAEYIQSLKSLKAFETTGTAASRDWAEKLVESSRVKLTLMGLNAQMIDAIAKSEGPDKTLLYVLPGQEAWVYADIFEYEIPLVKVGDTLEVEIAALSKKYSGRIRAIDTVVDSKTRTVRVRAVVKNDEGLLKPDLFVNVSLQVNLGSALTVPEEAVFLSGKSALVFVDKGQGLFEPRRVDLGQRAGEVYEIREGLAEGERVITNGNFLVDSESRLKAALSGMTGT